MPLAREKIASGAKSVWSDFKTFINKGSVVDLSVGLVMGAAFTAIVNSFVNDIISPIIGLIFQV
jgi:large conductance mechanosensitive channel